MNRCDDRAEPLFAMNFSKGDRSHCLRTMEEKFIADKGASEGAAVFMNNLG